MQDGAVLLGLRRGSHGTGAWSPPGGHVEYGEDPVDCVRREAFEETGIVLGECQFAGVTNDIFAAEGRHYVTLFYTATLAGGTPTVREPAKCDVWEWWPWSSLPDNLFLPLQHLREQGFVLPTGSQSPPVAGELRRICVFCGSSFGSQPVFLQQAEAFGRLLAVEGIELVYGGANVGLMGVLADAAQAAGGSVIGVIPQALVTVEIAHRGLADLRIVQTMHDRKQLMADLADAFVAMPGGFGTFDELLEIVTWAQLGIHTKAIGLLNTAGYYDPLLQMVERAVAEGFIPQANARLLYVEEEPQRLLARLRAHEPAPAVRTWVDPRQT